MGKAGAHLAGPTSERKRKGEEAKVITSGEIKEMPLKKDGDNLEGYLKT